MCVRLSEASVHVECLSCHPVLQIFSEKRVQMLLHIKWSQLNVTANTNATLIWLDVFMFL